MNIVLRSATQADYPAIADLLQTVHLPIEGVKEHLEHFFVATLNGKLVGCIAVEVYESEGLLRSAAVLPEYQHQGIGKQLYDTLLSFCKKRYIERLTLLTTTAEKYFAQLGFQKIDRGHVAPAVQTSVEFTSACPASAVCMQFVVK